MPDCLALTGTDSILPIMIVMGVLMVGGVVALFIAKRRAGWAALAILPLLIGASLLGAGAPPAQAASSCKASGQTAPDPSPTPTPRPSCTPGLPAEDITVGNINWDRDTQDGFDGWIQDLPDAVSDQLAAMMALSTDPTPTATVFAGVTIIVPQQGTESTSTTFDAEVVSSGVEDKVRLSTDQDFFYIPSALIDASVAGDGIPNDYFITFLNATITIPQDDGCGGTVTSTIQLSGLIAPA